ncbi:MAG: VOC family protein [Cyclobacteriaceae bacterium]|nr:VOC family protein [Cyclobacteriaceae bacterium]
MKQAIQPYLHFEENCKEAMQFYQSVFGGQLEIMSIAESPAKSQFPNEVHHQILHSTLHHGDFRMMASDMCGQGERTTGNAVQLSLDCESEEEINLLYQKLSEGGIIVSPLKEEFWGALFGMVIDRYGHRWMLSLEKK